MRFLNKYSLIKESFDYNKLILEIRYTKGWKELKNPSDNYPDSIFAAEYLIEKGYKLLLIIRKNGNIINAPFYLKNEIKNELIWLDSLITPIRNALFSWYRRYQSNSDYMIDIAKEQMDYYHQINKMPDEQDIKDMLTDITDLGFEIDVINFGYVGNRFPTDYWDRDIGSTKFGSAIKFVYAIYLIANEKSTKMDIRNGHLVSDNGVATWTLDDGKINKSREEISNFIERSSMAFNVRANVHYFGATGDENEMHYSKDDGVVIIFTNKN